MSTWSTSVVTWRESVYTFSDFSVAYELSQVGGTYTKRYQAYDDLFRQRPDKKKRVIELIMKVKSNKYKEGWKYL